MNTITPSEIELVETCYVCPEQYDALYNGNIIGYLRLRHGYFRVDYPNCGGDTIYEVNTVGDGRFDNEDERAFHLNKAKEVLALKYNGTRDLDTQAKCEYILENELDLWLQDMCLKYDVSSEDLILVMKNGGNV